MSAVYVLVRTDKDERGAVTRRKMVAVSNDSETIRVMASGCTNDERTSYSMCVYEVEMEPWNSPSRN